MQVSSFLNIQSVIGSYPQSIVFIHGIPIPHSSNATPNIDILIAERHFRQTPCPIFTPSGHCLVGIDRLVTKENIRIMVTTYILVCPFSSQESSRRAVLLEKKYGFFPNSVSLHATAVFRGNEI